MAHFFIKTGKLIVLSGVMTFGLTSNFVLAQNNEIPLSFKFNHLSNIESKDYSTVVDTDLPNLDSLNSELVYSGMYKLNTPPQPMSFTQYDATWSYPWETKSMNIDLGVTLRHLTGIRNAMDGLNKNRFEETLPLIHASAFYNFSFKGLTAGIESSHLDSSQSKVFDYRAKVSYEWRKGFGLQGGWQHQQFSLENTNENSTSYEVTGPFLDFYLNF